jgi:hypothetical protein
LGIGGIQFPKIYRIDLLVSSRKNNEVHLQYKLKIKIILPNEQLMISLFSLIGGIVG